MPAAKRSALQFTSKPISLPTNESLPPLEPPYVTSQSLQLPTIRKADKSRGKDNNQETDTNKAKTGQAVDSVYDV